METIPFQLGLDIATSLSILGATGLFISQQIKQRKIVHSQYLLDNFKEILSLLKNKKVELKRIQDEFRLKVIMSDEEKMIEQGVQLVREQNFKMLLLLESALEEFSLYVDHILPVFSDKNEYEKDSKTILEEARNQLAALVEITKATNDVRVEMEQLDKVDELLENAIVAVAKAMKSTNIVLQ